MSLFPMRALLTGVIECGVYRRAPGVPGARRSDARTAALCPRTLQPLQADGADLVFGDLGRGIVSRVGQEVGGRVGQPDEGDEDRAGSNGLGDPRVPGQLA